MTRWGKRSVETSVALRQRIPELDDLPPLTEDEERLFMEAIEKIKEIANRVKEQHSKQTMQQFGGAVAMAASKNTRDNNDATGNDVIFRNRKTVDMRVPAHRAGLVIGHHGETLRRIEKISQCKIQFDQHFHPSEPDRRLTITGLPEDIEEAQKLIREKVEEPVQTAASRFPTVQLPIPQSRVGLIIGKGGETIRELQERSGARITVQPESQLDYNAPPPTERTVNITGDEENIQRAKDLINDLLSGQLRGGMFGATAGNRQAITIQIPETSVGAVIGKKAETLRTLQSLSGCRIYVEPAPNTSTDSPSGAQQRSVHLTGAPEQVAYAQQLINEKVQQNEAVLQYAAAWESADQPSVVYQNPAELLGGNMTDPTMAAMGMSGAPGMTYDYAAYMQYYAQMQSAGQISGVAGDASALQYNTAYHQDPNAVAAAYAQYYAQYGYPTMTSNPEAPPGQ